MFPVAAQQCPGLCPARCRFHQADAGGGETELGRINSMLASVSVLETALLRQIKKFGYEITAVIAVVAVLVFAYGKWVLGMDFVELFLAVVGIAVSVIPEGLAALVPKPRVNLTRFHGVFAPHSKHRALVTPAKRGKGSKSMLAEGQDEETSVKRHAAMTVFCSCKTGIHAIHGNNPGAAAEAFRYDEVGKQWQRLYSGGGFQGK